MTRSYEHCNIYQDSKRHSSKVNHMQVKNEIMGKIGDESCNKKKANLTGTALEWSVPRPVDFKIVHVFQGKVGSMIVGNMIFCLI